MVWQDIVAEIAVASAGLIAGQMLAIGLSNQTDRKQPAAEWVRRFQLENRLFTRVMPAALLIPLVSLIACCMVADDKGRFLYLASTVGTVAVLVITMAVNVPINRQIAAWSPEPPPAAWAVTGERWLSWHWARTAIGIGAFILSVVAVQGA